MPQLKLWGSEATGDAAAAHSGEAHDPPAQDQRSEGALAQWLTWQLGQPVSVAYTDNRSTMMSYRESTEALRFRLHRAFKEAPAGVMHAIVGHVRWQDAEAGTVLDNFIKRINVDGTMRQRVLHPEGRFHHLSELFDDLNTTYFHGSCSAQITWGGGARRRYRRSIQLGVYVAGENLIRIHPALDQAFVPQRYVGWVVFHEMLHEVFGIHEAQSGRRVLHSKDFSAVESSYPDYDACKRWEAKNLPRLLNYRPRVQPR